MSLKVNRCQRITIPYSEVIMPLMFIIQKLVRPAKDQTSGTKFNNLQFTAVEGVDFCRIA